MKKINFSKIMDDLQKFLVLPETYSGQKNTNALHIIDPSVSTSDDGTGSLMTFDVEECPDWFFGIWWGYDSGSDSWKGECFAKYGYECYGDFSPYDSTLLATITAEGQDDSYTMDLKPLTDLLRFIQQNPEKAYFADIYEYSIEELESVQDDVIHKAYKEQKLMERMETKHEADYDDLLVATVHKFLDDRFIGFELKDVDCDPCYLITIPYEDNKKYFAEAGRYTLEDVFTEKELKELKKLEDKYEQLADKYEYCHYDQLQNIVVVK